MNTKSYYLRPWRVSDASFVIKLRNNPEYKQYFRQEKDITLKEQINFIKKAKDINYNAYILIGDDKRLGVFALHGSELCVVSPFEYIEIGVNILKTMYPSTLIFGEVFTYNHALKHYLNCGFEVMGVKEKYCKKNGEWVSVVKISYLCEC